MSLMLEWPMGAELETSSHEALRLLGNIPRPWPRRGGSWRPGAHPCKRAYDALKEAGHSPDVVRCYGLAPLPDVTSGRKQVKRLTGESYVPVLVLDHGEVIKASKNIVAWARDNPAGGAP
jgi:hypothetical protein